jgi:uncharacterized protein (DUF305 family)
MAAGILKGSFAALLALFLAAAAATGQQGQSAPPAAPIVQPGAPGQPSKIVSAASLAKSPRGPAPADTSFMQGMIHHHAQAVDMTDLLRTRTRTKDLQALAKRISISQTDEIKFMKQWLEERGKPAMDHSQMVDGKMPLMPGMLTAQQMQALAKSSGPAFDHLFLTGMIQHHQGALDMVKDLFDTPGAGQDSTLFDFATDIDNTQRAEIKIMQSMLNHEKNKEKK